MLVKAFRVRGYPVVVIEQNDANDRIPACREQNAILLIGNATEREMLDLARIREAKYLIAVCSSDATNAEVAAHARTMVEPSQGKTLTCSIHIMAPELWYVLRQWELTMGQSFQLQCFNVFDLEARVLTSLYPHEVIGQNQIAFIDRGAKDGLLPGNRLLLVRRGDAWRRTLSTTTTMYKTSPPTSTSPMRLWRRSSRAS